MIVSQKTNELWNSVASDGNYCGAYFLDVLKVNGKALTLQEYIDRYGIGSFYRSYIEAKGMCEPREDYETILFTDLMDACTDFEVSLDKDENQKKGNKYESGN